MGIRHLNTFEDLDLSPIQVGALFLGTLALIQVTLPHKWMSASHGEPIDFNGALHRPTSPSM